MSWLVSLGISLLCHSLVAVLLSLNPWPSSLQPPPTAYTVMLMPVTLAEPLPLAPTSTPLPDELRTPSHERTRPVSKPSKGEIVEKVKKREENREVLERLEKAMEEIRKQAALDAIQKRVEKREAAPPPVPIPSPQPSATSPIAPSPSLSGVPRQSKLNEYYGWIWARIKSSWTIPEPLLREGIDLETIIVIIIDREGRVRRAWFEKRSGNSLYDQMAMRAIIKADPLPPIPKELDLETLEVGIRFIPD
ncbi:MAG: TonB family protein [Desulfobacterota bacterium]|nr:TonB family protein [Thermodesulfobacteriota bacterium]